jgi:hypothetical protein
MKKIDLAQTITILANVGVIAGIVFLALELNQNSNQLALELEWQINDRIIQNNRSLMGENPTPIFVKSVTAPEDLTFEEFTVAGALVFNFLSTWEDRYFLYQAGLADEEDWKGYIDDDIDLTLGYRFAQVFWEESKGFFEPEFVEYVDMKLPLADSEGNFRWWQNVMNRLQSSD